MLRRERREEDRHRQRDRQPGQRPPATGAVSHRPVESAARSGRLGLVDQVGPGRAGRTGATRPVIIASPSPIAGVDQGHPAQDAEELGPAARGRQLDGERPGGQQDREPGRDHRRRQDPPPRRRSRGGSARRSRSPPTAPISPMLTKFAPRAVRPPSPKSRHCTIRTAADHHRAGPGAEHHRREDPAEQVARDRQRADREVDHLRGEDERRHRPHQHRRPLARAAAPACGARRPARPPPAPPSPPPPSDRARHPGCAWTNSPDARLGDDSSVTTPTPAIGAS